MNLRRMHSKYRSRCKRCQGRISVGAPIYWSKETGAVCLSCGDNSPADARSTMATNSAKRIEATGRESYSVDWVDVKEFAKEMFATGEVPASITIDRNRRTIRSEIMNPDEYFHGYTKGQVQRWIDEGYRSEGIRSLREFTPPVRDKRRLQFVEEGDEFHLDLAHNGDDNYMSQWTKRQTIPGLRVDFITWFRGSVNARVVNDFNRWAGNVIYSLESSGVDCEVNYCGSRDVSHHWTNPPAKAFTRIRVKKEGEVTDFVSISPMLSPAAYRTFGWIACLMHGESIGSGVSSGISGGTIGVNGWDIQYDEDAQTITITTHPDATEFPEEEMTAKLRELLSHIQN
jgi:hypothetical protein